MLSKISLAINAVLLILVINLYVQNCDTNEGEIDVVETTVEDVNSNLRIAYINTDTLDANYLYAIDIVKTLQEEMEKKQRRLERKATKFQQEFSQMQQYANTMTPTQLQAAQQRAMQMEQEIQVMQNDLAAEFAEEQNALQLSLMNDLDSFLLEYNKSAEYDFIIKKHLASELLLANNNFDITTDVLKKINEGYLNKGEKKDSL
jgi:Skp family chaperone for outer membrane proteins